jgi:PPIC-type PPIASE domain
MAQPRFVPAFSNPANQASTNQGSPASSQNSPQPASEKKTEPGEEKSGLENGGKAGQPKAAAEASKVPLDAPVVTIDGFCDPTALSTVVKNASAGCTTVLTRQQFEQLADALDPNMSPAFRHELAVAIPRILLFSKKAREMGVDKDPRYAQMMKWSSLQTLANALGAQLQKKAESISDAEIEKYYKDNQDKFQQCELQRIFIPKDKPESSESPANPKNQEDAAPETAMKAEAEKIQAKAAAGGDFVALQREAYDTIGIKSSPPNVNLGKRMRANLPQPHRQVFDLQAGQVSELFSDGNGFYLYKVVTKQLIPLTQAKVQIRKTLESDRMEASAESLFGSVKTKFNQAYFGSPTPAAEEDPLAKPAPATETAPGPPGTTPSSQTLQTASLDKEWADSSVRSYVYNKGSDAFVGPPESVVPSSAPVIILEGLCGNKPAGATDCQTTVTRADFEAMMHAIDPKADANALMRWADQYAQLVTHGEKGHQMGLEDTEQYKLAMTFLAMDNRFKLLNTFIEERSKELTDADLEEFYRANPRLFEEIKAVRIVIPQYKAFPPGGTLTPEQNAAGHAAMKKEAESIAARAALPGADFQALENEGWKFSNYVEEPPDVVDTPILRWEIWPRTRLFLFDLKVGEVSRLIDEPKNGFYVYKIVAKREVPFEEGRAYIRKRYAGERFLDTTSRLLATIKFSLNDQYFAKETPESAPAAPGQQPSTEKSTIPSLDIKVPKKIELQGK